MKNIGFISNSVISTIFLVLSLNFQNYTFSQEMDKPKLVVGIVVDQMRAEYLYRFYDNYSDDGFKRLMDKGFSGKNTHYDYIPTETGPGHATIFTGTTPANHGIVSNNWYDRKSGKTMYCVADSTVSFIRSSTDTSADKNLSPASPRNLLGTTISDELKLHTNKRSRVIGLSLKDRAAILPVGHLADYAFWFDEKSGDFISSSYYTDILPSYINTFNNKRKSDELLNTIWKPLLSDDRYKNSNPDDSEHEKIFVGRTKATFPYDLGKLKHKNGGYSLLMHSPFGNTLLTDLATTVIKEENLGQGETTDFISISYSSTDKVGHDFGIRSKELEDTYIRLDRELAELLEFLDDEVGEGNYLLFLTADHAASDNPKFLKEVNIPAGTYNPKSMTKILNDKLKIAFGEDTKISFMDNTQLYVDTGEVDRREVLYKIQEYMNDYEGVKEVYLPTGIKTRVSNGEMDILLGKSYNRGRSGDVYVTYHPGWMQDWGYGATHYTSYNNDTHVPMLWYGWNIRPGQSVKKYTTDQIASTLSMLLSIPFPSSAQKETMQELFNN